jgi:F0F1-type ATP synthase assembly protein I
LKKEKDSDNTEEKLRNKVMNDYAEVAKCLYQQAEENKDDEAYSYLFTCVAVIFDFISGLVQGGEDGITDQIAAKIREQVEEATKTKPGDYYS